MNIDDLPEPFAQSLSKIGMIALLDDNIFCCVVANDARLVPFLLARMTPNPSSIVGALDHAIIKGQHEDIKNLIPHLPPLSALNGKDKKDYLYIPYNMAHYCPGSPLLVQICQHINPIKCMIMMKFEDVLSPTYPVAQMVPIMEQLWILASPAQKAAHPKKCKEYDAMFNHPTVIRYAPILNARSQKEEMNKSLPNPSQSRPAPKKL